MKNLEGYIQTVQGLIEPKDLGITLTHEHILSDATSTLSRPSTASEQQLFDSPVSIDTLTYIKHYNNSFFCADDFRLSDITTAIKEVSLYKQYGGNSLVEVSSLGLGRDPVGLARVSRATGVNIIMGSSYYVPVSHPPDMDKMSEESLVHQITNDIVHGVHDLVSVIADDTIPSHNPGPKAGIIGEVGCWYPLTVNGLKVLRASGRAQAITGAPLSIHPGRHVEAPFEIIDILDDVDVDLNKVIIGHVERTFNHGYDFKRLAEKGCYLEWDLFGEERSFYDGNPEFDMPSDAVRLDQIAALISEGYGNKILVAHDIAYKHRLVSYGGHGYFYMLANIVPRMEARGFREESIQRLLVENPREALTFSKSRDKWPRSL